MNVQEILSLPQSEWLTELKVDPVKDRNITANIKYYSGEHPILKDPSRQDYFIPKWEIDEETGQPKTDANGKKIRGASETVKRTRLILNYQQQIVDTAVGMVVGNPVTLTLNNNEDDSLKEAFDIFVDQWRNKTRLDTFSSDMARALFIESKCAELYFHEDGESDGDIKVMLLSKENGDDIWAHFDDNRRMDALTRVYTKRAIVDGKADDVEVTQIYTAEKKLEKIEDGEWIETKNPYEKLQIVYYDQKYPEWHLVTDLISKQELVRSQNSDVNKRIGNPNVVVDGTVSGMPDVEQDVKVWNTIPSDDGQGGKIKSSVNYLQLEGAPEAIKMELQDHKQDMYKLTWPDLSFLRDAIKTGTLSGTAIKLMFTDAFVKIGNKKKIFEDFSRRIAVMKRMLAVGTGNSAFEELNISVQFNSILPENLGEIAETLATAVNNEITSKSHAQGLFPANAGNPNVGDEIDEEISREQGGTA